MALVRRIPPSGRLALVIAATSVPVLFSDVRALTAFFAASVLLLATAKQVNYKVSAFLVSSTMLLFFMSNFLFSPGHDGTTWGPIVMNRSGVVAGIVGALRRGTILAISLTWLYSTTLPDTYRALEWLGPFRHWILVFLRNIQLLQREFVLANYSLRVRESKSTRAIVGGYFEHFRLLLQALLLRLFVNTGLIAYAAETHLSQRGSFDGNVSLDNITVYYGTTAVLTDITLRISSGECILVKGESGSGKTTLLRLISGFIPRVEGQYIGSVIVADLADTDLGLSAFGARVRLFSSDPSRSILGLTVGQEMLLAASNENEARDALAKMGLGALWERQTTTLSGGEQARLQLASTLASGVNIILFDAPLQELDAQGREDFLAALRKLKKTQRGKTILITDPLWEPFDDIADRTIVLKDGRLVEQESIEKSCRTDIGESNGFRRESSRHASIANVKNITLAYDGRMILSRVSLSVSPGEIVVLVGPNGSGKTSLLLALAGLLKVNAGERHVDREITMVFQNALMQMVEATAVAEISLRRRLHGQVEQEYSEAVNEDVAWVDVIGAEVPMELDSGRLRLLSIAAMKARGQLMLLDEPTLGLDESQTHKCIQSLVDLAADGTAIVASSHDRRLISIASRAVELSRTYSAATTW